MTFTKLHRKHEALWMFYFSVFPRMLYPFETILFWRDPCSSTIQIVTLQLAHQLGAAPLVYKWSDTPPSKFSKNDPGQKVSLAIHTRQVANMLRWVWTLGMPCRSSYGWWIWVVACCGALWPYQPRDMATKISQENFLDDYPSSKNEKATWPSRNGDLFQRLGH